MKVDPEKVDWEHMSSVERIILKMSIKQYKHKVIIEYLGRHGIKFKGRTLRYKYVLNDIIKSILDEYTVNDKNKQPRKKD